MIVPRWPFHAAYFITQLTFSPTDVKILPQKDGNLSLIFDSSVYIRFNGTQVSISETFFQTLRDMKIILSYDYNDHNVTFVFDSESSGIIEVIPKYPCATISLRMFILTMRQCTTVWCFSLALGSPVDPQNGHVEYRYQASTTGDTITIAVFTCDEGYSLNGSETVVFDTSWRWSGDTEPVCEGLFIS